MSWTFEITADTTQDAERLFNNALVENQSFIDNNTGSKIKAMAKSALYAVPNGSKITLRCYGHMDPATMMGNFGVNAEFVKLPEVFIGDYGNTLIVDGDNPS